MAKTILEYLERNTNKSPNKIIFSDNKEEITYIDFRNKSKELGTYIIKQNLFNKPVGILIDKNINSLISMIGTLYSGNYYTVIDIKQPIDRIKYIIETLECEALIIDSKTYSLLDKINYDGLVINVDEVKEYIDEKKLSEVYTRIIDTNPMYILFTSGSTGVPKGTIVQHKAVLSYLKWFSNCFNINNETIFGSQTPFYFSMSISDVFSTIMNGSSLNIIPKMYFSFPIKLLEYLNEKKINTIYWVPSALSIVANLNALSEIKLPYLKKVLFAGEVMPTKQLNIWMDNVDAEYANLYGPTETVDICTYYKINKRYENDEMIPIGYPCDNIDILILKEDNTEAKINESGELCVRGSFLAAGYLKNEIKTKEVFINNPLNKNYDEIIYKTGDIVKKNEEGILIYLSRKDNQVKHMGYRIELGEIENKILSLEKIINCCSIYDKEEDKIILYYQSEEIDDILLMSIANKVLPNYMVPNKAIKIKSMPYNSNGKIDRKKLLEEYKLK